MFLSKKHKALKGINLGGWLVFEKWIKPSLFENTDALDEFNLVKNIPKEKIEEHYKTFIIEEDFKFLSEQGIEVLRIPVGYWIFGDFPPFLKNVEYLDFAFDMAGKYGLEILIDLHAAPGSQNGYDHSGVIGERNWDKDPYNISKTLDIIEKLSKRYSNKKNLFGIELLNEPHFEIDIKILEDFYKKGYETVRKYCNDNVFVVISDAFRPNSWNKFFKINKFKNIALDTHFYQCFTEENKNMNIKSFFSKSKIEWGRFIRKTQRNVPIIAGEWSLGIDINNCDFLNNPNDQRCVNMCSSFGKHQINIFNKSLAWFFWTYKTETDNPYGWSFKDLVDKNILKIN
jgi:glucan 1,3-beta-glucosidase